VTWGDAARWIHAAAAWLGSSGAGHFGGFLGGIAAFAGFCLAAHQLRRWRRDRLDERRGDAAARALESLVRVCHLMRGWCALLRSESRPDEQFAMEAGREVLAFYTKIEQKIEDELIHGVHETLVSSVALLDDPETAPLREVQEAANLFQNEMNGRLARLGALGDRASVARALADMADSLDRRIAEFEAVERRGREVLLPIARLRAGRRA
jgi:hypothetical protein